MFREEFCFIMYICPICRREYTTDEAVAKCFLRCWREEHPCQKSCNAPHSEDIFDRKFLFYLNISIFSRLRFLSLLVMVLPPLNCMCSSRCPFHLRCISYSYTEVLYTTSFCMMSEGEEQFHRLPERLPFNN